MAKHTESHFGFEQVSEFHAGAFRKEAHFVCGCGARHRQALPREGLNPEAVAKRARGDGWKADPWHSSVAKCPSCQAKSRAGEKPNKVIPMTPPPAQAVPREPTQAERLAIRNLLDKHFDDGAGCYLDGYSDQRLGEEAKVPWAIVTRIREAAYGPIRVDPVVAGIRAEIRGIEEALAKRAEADKALAAQVADVVKKVEALAGRKVA